MSSQVVEAVLNHRSKTLFTISASAYLREAASSSTTRKVHRSWCSSRHSFHHPRIRHHRRLLSSMTSTRLIHTTTSKSPSSLEAVVIQRFRRLLAHRRLLCRQSRGPTAILSSNLSRCLLGSSRGLEEAGCNGIWALKGRRIGSRVIGCLRSGKWWTLGIPKLYLDA